MPSHHGAPPQHTSPGQHFPPREETPHQPPNQPPQQPAPINTSSPPQHYTPYSQPSVPPAQPYNQPPLQGGRPQSTYGAQELATSVYDSPIAPHNPQAPAPFAYPQDDAVNDNPSASPPPSHGQYSGQPQYPSFGGAPDQAPPPVPTGQPPQPPPDAAGHGLAPAPLQVGGPASFDARQGLPSQAGGQQQQQPQQYKPYVPPGSFDEPSAPAPNDYYRSGVY